jgi:hypothetical protein
MGVNGATSIRELPRLRRMLPQYGEHSRNFDLLLKAQSTRRLAPVTMFNDPLTETHGGLVRSAGKQVSRVVTDHRIRRLQCGALLGNMHVPKRDDSLLPWARIEGERRDIYRLGVCQRLVMPHSLTGIFA